MNCAANNRGRPPLSKVYVPYTEEYMHRLELRRNAILADVIRPANLGPDPISAIKTALASRFGEYTEDFAIARCRERDFAIFLPKWVPATVLTRREVLTLNGFWHDVSRGGDTGMQGPTASSTKHGSDLLIYHSRSGLWRMWRR